MLVIKITIEPPVNHHSGYIDYNDLNVLPHCNQDLHIWGNYPKIAACRTIQVFRSVKNNHVPSESPFNQH